MLGKDPTIRDYPLWMLIDSAPLDGTRIIGWCSQWTGPITVSFVNKTTGWVCHCEHRLKYQPTHWVPLPSVPTTKTY